MRIGPIFFAVVLCAACGGRTQLGGMIHADGGEPDSSQPSTQTNGVVLNDCAPNDGPAYTFRFGSSSQCDVAGPNAAVITIWSPWPPTLGPNAIGDGSFASGSSAYVCQQPNQPCMLATGGTLVLNQFQATSGGGASGSYTLSLPDGTTVSATFTNAAFCGNSAMCG